MKILTNRAKLGLVFLLGLVLQTSVASIVPRELGKNKKDKKKPAKAKEEDLSDLSPTEKLFKELENFFDNKLAPLKPEKKDEGEGSLLYDMPEKKSKVTMQVSGTQIDVNLVNEYESQEFQMENVEFEDERELIEQEYVDKFIGHVDQVRSDLGNIFESVKEGLESASFSGFFEETSFNQVKPAKSKEKDSFLFDINYLNNKLIMSNDPIFGEVRRDGSIHTLRIVTKFFQKTFELAVVTDMYLKTEARRLAERVLAHLDSMYYLNEDPDETGMEKYFTFDEYKEHLEEMLTNYLGDGFEVVMEDQGLTVKHDGSVVATANVEMTDANGLMFTVIKAQLEILQDQSYALVLPDTSIYTMNALADKFFLELMDYVKHAANKANPEDSVGVFE